MAEYQGVWGIEIGQAGLKAVRLRYAEAAQQAIAVAFDYVPHPKILSQPDAIPEELIPQALETFLSRNEIDGDRIAISLPGQTALARFIQLPPVESSKVDDIVKYEARQQIPFDLEDVIWDYQTLGGGVEESGYMLQAEVGLFAMKREQVQQQLQPFLDAKVEVELVQIAPLALYNFLCYDRLGIRVGEEFEAGDEYNIMLDMGADNTTLMVSNGEKIWIRNVPIGGNHFTRALTKEMKLTFAKAEHLKCNATKSPDPRAVFQALRPVFNDYVSEIQRSIGYFSSVNRDAKIGRVMGVGNGFKLAGLQKFLQQNLQYEVERIESFDALAGDTVLSAPLFQENILSFVVPYGLALQAMDLTRIKTTLLPPEIATARKIRRKKPWAVATAATLLFGLALSSVGNSYVLESVSTERFGDAESELDSLKSTVGQYQSSYSSAESTNQQLISEGDQLVELLETRELWPELYKSLNSCLPRDTREEVDVTKRHRIKIRSITAEKHDDLSEWFNELQTRRPGAIQGYMLPQDVENPPSGEGYVFTLKGVHYHKEEGNPEMEGPNYVNNTFLANLNSWTVKPEKEAPVPVRQLGLSHATILEANERDIPYYPKGKRRGRNPNQGRGNAEGFYGAPGADPGYGGDRRFVPRGGASAEEESLEEPEVIQIPETTFTVQFAWKPTPPSERPAEPSSNQDGEAGAEGT